MTTVLVHSSPPDIRVVARRAINDSLYIKGWSLRGILTDAINSPNDFKLASAYVGEEMVGIACLESGMFISVFVKPEYRKQGIASKMFEKLHIDHFCEAVIGEPQSKFLFESFGVNIQDD